MHRRTHHPCTSAPHTSQAQAPPHPLPPGSGRGAWTSSPIALPGATSTRRRCQWPSCSEPGAHHLAYRRRARVGSDPHDPPTRKGSLADAGGDVIGGVRNLARECLVEVARRARSRGTRPASTPVHPRPNHPMRRDHRRRASAARRTPASPPTASSSPGAARARRISRLSGPPGRRPKELPCADANSARPRRRRGRRTAHRPQDSNERRRRARARGPWRALPRERIS